jgi:uncharacterized protein
MRIERRKLIDEVALALQQRIIDLGLQEGDKMPSHAALAEDLSISIPSLREGLQVLGALGILRLEHGRGTIVGRPSISEYARSLNPNLLSRSYSVDEGIGVLTVTIGSLIDELGGSQRRNLPLEPSIEALRTAVSPSAAGAAVTGFYTDLVAPLGRALISDIVELAIRLVLATPSILESLRIRAETLAGLFGRLAAALEGGKAEEARLAVEQQGEFYRSLVPKEQRLACGTGSIGGTFYSAGLELATALRDLGGDQLYPEPTAGGIDNLRRLASGGVDIAFTQAHVARAAYGGQEPFDRPMPNLRVICCTHSLDLWIVTSAASGIQDLRQLRGKRVSLGTRGGETSRMASAVLDSYGMQGAAVERRFLSVSQAADALSTGQIDVLFYLTGGMGTALARLAESHSLQLLGIDDAVLEGLCAGDPGRRVSSVSIHEGAEKVPTLLVETLLVCKESLPPERVTGILRAVRLAAKTSAILDPQFPEAGEPPIHPGAADA